LPFHEYQRNQIGARFESSKIMYTILNPMLTPHLTYEHRHIIESHHLASALGSGGVAVFGTPALVALCETASFLCVAPHLELGQTTVGTFVEIHHLAATPLGMEVRAVATLIAVEGRRLTFTVEAWDEVEKIGECRHERVIVDEQKFITRIHQKIDASPSSS
jgi:fluoroacetyl-CoA thioesterase